MFDGRPCLFCLNATTARIGFDKRGKPFVHCCACGARTFLPNFAPCMNGLAVLSPYVQAIAEEVGSDPVALAKHKDTIGRFLAGLTAQIRGAGAVPSVVAIGVAPIHVPSARVA